MTKKYFIFAYNICKLLVDEMHEYRDYITICRTWSQTNYNYNNFNKFNAMFTLINAIHKFYHEGYIFTVCE